MHKLDNILQDWAETLVEQACGALGEVRLPHYTLEREEEIRKRLAKLLQQTLRSLKDEDATPLVSYIERVANERFSAGYDLFEVQTSINILEEVLWKRTLSSMEPDEVAGSLGKLNTIFSLAKDTLAQRYVSLIEGDHS